MSIVALVLLAAMLVTYALLDGYDLGVGAVVHLFSRSDKERGRAIASIGPFWNGNEVWLIAAGGVLFAFFPRAYAASFSGFYLPFMVVLWLLIFRGIALELRSHYPGRLWHDFWDWAFSLSSAALALILGVALGNLLRGLPLDAHATFVGSFAYCSSTRMRSWSERSRYSCLRSMAGVIFACVCRKRPRVQPLAADCGLRS